MAEGERFGRHQARVDSHKLFGVNHSFHLLRDCCYKSFIGFLSAIRNGSSSRFSASPLSMRATAIDRRPYSTPGTEPMAAEATTADRGFVSCVPGGNYDGDQHVRVAQGHSPLSGAPAS